MSFIDNLVRSKRYKNFMSKLYGWGASVLIVGALFKINHWPGAVFMLIIGMGIEFFTLLCEVLLYKENI